MSANDSLDYFDTLFVGLQIVSGNHYAVLRSQIGLPKRNRNRNVLNVVQSKYHHFNELCLFLSLYMNSGVSTAWSTVHNVNF